MKVEKLLGHIGQRRGLESEQKVTDLFDSPDCREFFPGWVRGYTVASGKDDAKGIDGWVHTDVGKIPIQIKSSRRRALDAQKKRPEIPIVVIRIGESNQRLIGKCVAAVSKKRKEYLRQR